MQFLKDPNLKFDGDLTIPHMVYQTWKDDNIPSLISYWTLKMMKVNNDFGYKMYNDAEVEVFIQEHYCDEILEIYRRIKTGAFKSDFFRVLLLYRFGGVYIDLDECYLKPLANLTKHKKAIIIEPHFMLFPKLHPILEKVIQEYIKNPNDVENKDSFYLISLRKVLSQASPDDYFTLPHERKFMHHILGAKVAMYPDGGKDHWTVNNDSDRKKYIKSKGGKVLFWINRYIGKAFCFVTILIGIIKVKLRHYRYKNITFMTH